jgi:Fe-S cluster assembly iron-binding protein IscA
MQEDGSRQLVFISVRVEQNCSGFQYVMEFRETNAVKNVVLTSSEGVALAIARDNVAFLRGSTLDYVPDAAGFKFDNPHEDTSLLPEYQAKRAEEARLRPIEEARAKQINPELAVADLLTSRRQQAFVDLQLWWKFYQPEAYEPIDVTVG